MKGRLNAYKTTMMGRPVMKTSKPIYAPTVIKTEDKPLPKPVSPGPFALWQWLKQHT